MTKKTDMKCVFTALFAWVVFMPSWAGNESPTTVEGWPQVVSWTRVNATTHEYVQYIKANEQLRATERTSIDFAGGDAYGKSATQLTTFMPNNGKNYKMIMECGVEENGYHVYPFAALTTNTAFSYYDYVGPDSHGLYDMTSTKGVVTSHNESTRNLIRTQNRLLNSVMHDVATKAAGKGMKIHNGTGKDASTTKGVMGTKLEPLSPTQAISICRSDSELVLLTVQCGNPRQTLRAENHVTTEHLYTQRQEIQHITTFNPLRNYE